MLSANRRSSSTNSTRMGIAPFLKKTLNPQNDRYRNLFFPDWMRNLRCAHPLFSLGLLYHDDHFIPSQFLLEYTHFGTPAGARRHHDGT
jgi:hypothetical protein